MNHGTIAWIALGILSLAHPAQAQSKTPNRGTVRLFWRGLVTSRESAGERMGEGLARLMSDVECRSFLGCV